jgi:hypothetical protein
MLSSLNLNEAFARGEFFSLGDVICEVILDTLANWKFEETMRALISSCFYCSLATYLGFLPLFILIPV